MEKSLTGLILFFFIIILLVMLIVPRQPYVYGSIIWPGEEKWIYSKPQSVIMNYTCIGNSIEVRLVFVFRHGGYRLEYKGYSVEGDYIRIYYDVLEYTGPSIQVITYKNQTLNITIDNPVGKNLVLYINNNEYTSVAINKCLGVTDTSSSTTSGNRSNVPASLIYILIVVSLAMTLAMEATLAFKKH